MEPLTDLVKKKCTEFVGTCACQSVEVPGEHTIQRGKLITFVTLTSGVISTLKEIVSLIDLLVGT